MLENKNSDLNSILKLLELEKDGCMRSLICRRLARARTTIYCMLRYLEKIGRVIRIEMAPGSRGRPIVKWFVKNDESKRIMEDEIHKVRLRYHETKNSTDRKKLEYTLLKRIDMYDNYFGE